ncbi:MAG: sporulation protein YqfC [Clostridiales bacterium]|nr:sporulation protein YqfC [Clostridiales bacterium]
MSKKKRKIKLGRRILETLEIPEEAYSDTAKITLWGKKTLLLEQHSGIFECGEKRIRLFTEPGILRIEGEDLVLLELSDERLYVTGKIESVIYER